jgi:glyoxylase-like metal-dependent hydrolase (beta-lactamase superfamily II)
MRIVSPPPASPAPLIASLTAPSGPPWTRYVERAGAAVLAVPGRYCVTYVLVADEAVAVVDVGSRGDVPRVLAALRWLGRPAEQVRFVIPTHLHFDHVIGIDALAAELRAPLALGEVAAAHVQRGRPLRWPSRRHLLRATVTWIFQGMPLPPRDDVARGYGFGFGFPWAADRFAAPLAAVLRHGEELPGLPGWRALATPGHADDAICLHHAAAGFLLTGDTIRNYLGGEWNPLLCDEDDQARSRELLMTLSVQTIFPGHGPLVEGEDALRRLRTLPFYLP